MIGWVVNVILCLLLSVALFGGWILNKRLLLLRKERLEMEGLVQALNGALGRAESSVHILRATTKEAESALGERITKARALADELSIVTQTGERLASRLENGLTVTKLPTPEKIPEPQARVRKYRPLEGVR